MSLDGRWALLGGEKFIGFRGIEEGVLRVEKFTGFLKSFILLLCFF